MPDLGPAELLIVLAIVVLVFGGSRLAELGGALGKSVREFKKASSEPLDEAADEPLKASAPEPSKGTAPVGEPVLAPSSGEHLEGLACRSCGTVNAAGARFCSQCGASLSAGPSAATSAP